MKGFKSIKQFIEEMNTVDEQVPNDPSTNDEPTPIKVKTERTSYLVDVLSKNIYYNVNKQEIFKLENKIYKIFFDNHSYIPYLHETISETDELYDLDNPQLEYLLNDINQFMNSKEYFNKYKFIFKRGYLLYGKQGIGKTSVIRMLFEKFIREKHDAIMIYYNSNLSINHHIDMLTHIKTTEPDKIIFFVIEDIDALVERKDNESDVLNLLDGASQLSGVIFFATTNYGEELKKSLTNRPNRFDIITKVEPPSKEVRKKFFDYKFNILDEEDRKNYDIEKIVKDTESFSMAHCQEFFKSIVIFKKDYNEALEYLRKLNKEMALTNNDSGSIGFNR